MGSSSGLCIRTSHDWQLATGSSASLHFLTRSFVSFQRLLCSLLCEAGTVGRCPRQPHRIPPVPCHHDHFISSTTLLRHPAPPTRDSQKKAYHDQLPAPSQHTRPCNIQGAAKKRPRPSVEHLLSSRPKLSVSSPQTSALRPNRHSTNPATPTTAPTKAPAQFLGSLPHSGLS
ncbi:hypothetical protein BGZ61DRAFT_134460 [Ilyonectria robusta]|uniref:uncharacterized protein n=1 Tax=Ilyonectria robusta TaxID=1079257 RepID=UPI001E8D4CBE|nr:uncharacterized protein BGZ61DRAFT_134460 [Ilyonectria robusta]KAH8735064.1 hypothetical protein BGZ61DRAFT_134460 [Ilyonectria robusta]